jgi:hypothetical protein
VIPVLLKHTCEIDKSQRNPNPYGFNPLPKLKCVSKSKADIAWLIYDLELIKDKKQGPGRYSLKKVDEVFTEFESVRRDFLITYDNADEVKSVAREHGFKCA